MARFITAADAVIILSCPAVYPTPFQLQGFATDDVFSTDSIDIAETMMGVDGRLSGGYVPREVRQTFNLQADSESIDRFETIYSTQVTQRAIYAFSGVFTLKSVQRTYNASRGFLTGYTPSPTAKKVLQPRQFIITWEGFSPGPSA
jgi:hypothetical protein